MHPLRSIPLLFSLFLCLLLAGCLEVDGQEITIRRDEAADRIDIHVVHRGLFAEGGQGSGNDPIAKAVKDLAEVRAGGEVVLWCNWPATFDLTRDYPAPVQALLANVDVENGGLFTDPQGLLCGHQFVRIRNATAVVKQLNTLLELWVQTQLAGGTAGRGGRHSWDDDTKEAVREFLRSGEKLLVVESGRIEVRLPLSARDHAWFKGQLEKLVLDSVPREMVRRRRTADHRAGGGDPTETSFADGAVTVPGEQLNADLQRAPTNRFLWDNEFSWQREPELTRVSLGVKGGDLRVVKASGGLYHPALLNKLRENGEAIEDGIPDQELARRFDAFQKRDAVLPPKVAELRAASANPKGAPSDPKPGDGK